MKTSDKIGIAFACAYAITCFVGAIWCYGKSQYYQGRADAAREMRDELIKIKKEYENDFKEKDSVIESEEV